MHKRLPLSVICLAVTALAAPACGPAAGDGGANTPTTPPAASASASPSASPSTTGVRGLTGYSSAFYLRTIRKHYPALDRVGDEELVAHGNALCVTYGQAFVDQALKTKKELGLTGEEASQVIGTAHGACGRKTL
ncbi:hypothetical protein [Streptomyces sp. NPDC012888]|uniref:hypothetical protein n=1 Tax=Streptomyces sp. NPDC012888 TaxID=3364855 RepID=UPI00368C3772